MEALTNEFMTTTAPAIAAPDLLDIDAVCSFLGGSKPVDRSTVWRRVRQGLIPPPVPELKRWVRSELEAARDALIAKRGTARA
jgi:predicted DNA-binding transcriptional regulator AlpA